MATRWRRMISPPTRISVPSAEEWKIPREVLSMAWMPRDVMHPEEGESIEISMFTMAMDNFARSERLSRRSARFCATCRGRFSRENSEGRNRHGPPSPTERWRRETMAGCTGRRSEALCLALDGSARDLSDTRGYRSLKSGMRRGGGTGLVRGSAVSRRGAWVRSGRAFPARSRAGWDNTHGAG